MYLFAYGTLRRALAHPMHRVLARRAAFAGEAWYQGRLYDLGAYPAAVPSQDAADRVRGEVYALAPAVVPAVLRALDRYEGFDPERPEAGEYRRVLEDVARADGSRLRAWIYLYRLDPSRLPRIASGDYVAYRSQHRNAR